MKKFVIAIFLFAAVQAHAWAQISSGNLQTKNALSELAGNSKALQNIGGAPINSPQFTGNPLLPPGTIFASPSSVLSALGTGPLAIQAGTSPANAVINALGYTPPQIGTTTGTAYDGGLGAAAAALASGALQRTGGAVTGAINGTEFNSNFNGTFITNAVAIGNSHLGTIVFSDPTNTGAYVQENSQISVSSTAASINQSTHVVATKGQVNYTGTGPYFKIFGIEGETQNVGTGSLSLTEAVDAYIGQNAGTIGTAYGVNIGWGQNNTGTITSLVGFNFPNISAELPGTIGSEVAFQNLDPNASIVNYGVMTDSRNRYYTPAVAVGRVTGRQYYGVAPSAPNSNTVTSLLSNVNWVPFYAPASQTYTTLDFDVVTAVSGATCQVAIYASANGQAVGAPIATVQNLSAATAGIVTASISAPLVAGLNIIGIQCSTNSVTLGTYVENAAPSIFGSTVSTYLDNNPVTPTASVYPYVWPTAPTWVYVARGSNISGLLPLISMGF